MKKHIARLLLCAMLASSFVSCSESAINEETMASADAPVAETAGNVLVGETVAETEEIVRDDLPEETFGGYTYSIYTRSNTNHYQFLVEEMNGEVLNDAIHQREATIEERFAVDLTELVYSDNNAPMTMVQAGDDTYSLMNVRCTTANTMAQKNYCYAIDTLEYINLSKPYWDAQLTQSIAIGPRSYSALGAANLNTIDYMNVLLFNKDLAAEYNLENLYTLVREGKWTFDKFGEIAGAVTSDLNGDGTYDKNDRWGLLGTTKYTHCSLIQAGGTMYIQKDENGYPYCAMATDEHFIDVFTKIFEICNDNNAWYNTTDSTNEGTEYHNMFRNGQGLFLSTMFYFVESLRDMDYDFGVLPYPKYDENQVNYRARVNFFDSSVIPTTSQDIRRTAIILEALTCESFNSVVPAYKEIALKSKYARDPDSADMIDLIMNNRVLDMGDTYFVDNIRDSFVYQMFYNNDRNIASKVRVNQKVIGKLIEKMVDEYEKLEAEQ